MGQAAVDLPDPMQNPAPAKGPSADDLLAQLAGEEIDRLLAEADVEPSTWPSVASSPTSASNATSASISPSSSSSIIITTAPAAASISSSAPITSPPPGAVLITAPSSSDPHTAAEAANDPHVEPEPQLAPPTPIAEADVEELDARISQELDSLFTELNSDSPPPAAAAQPAPAAVAPAAAAAVGPDASVTGATPMAMAAEAPLDPMAHVNELERQVLGKTLLDALGGPEGQSQAEETDRWAILLKPLEWMNRPLQACSDTVREALGKVAIMTLINALAILVYVLFLRRH